MATSTKFDPYHKWFGIPPSQQPPTHYRLLGLEPFEPDREVIDAAANQRIAYLQDIAAGPNGDASQKLLNEVAAARRSLLNPKTKNAYDEELRHNSKPNPIEDENEPFPSSGFEFEAAALKVEPLDEPESPKPSRRSVPRSAPVKSDGNRALPWLIGGAIGLVLIAGIIIAIVATSGGAKTDREAAAAAKVDPPPKTVKTTPRQTARPPEKNVPGHIVKDPIPKELPPPPSEVPPTVVPPRPPVNPTPMMTGIEGLGNWQITNGQEISTVTEDGFLLFGDPSWRDYDFSVQASHTAANGTIILFVRTLSQRGGYAVQFGVGNGDSTIISLNGRTLKLTGKPETGLKPNTYTKLTVKVRGTKLECLADGKILFEATDKSHQFGRVGIKGAGIKFKDFEVLDPDGKVLFQGMPLRKN